MCASRRAATPSSLQQQAARCGRQPVVRHLKPCWWHEGIGKAGRELKLGRLGTRLLENGTMIHITGSRDTVHLSPHLIALLFAHASRYQIVSLDCWTDLIVVEPVHRWR